MIQVKGTLVNFAKGGELFPEDNMLKSPPKPKPKAVLWRYMSFEKYIDVLINRGVFFSYPGRLRDPFEGMVPPLTRKRLYEWLIQKHKAPFHQFYEIVNIFIHKKKKANTSFLVGTQWSTNRKPCGVYMPVREPGSRSRPPSNRWKRLSRVALNRMSNIKLAR